MPKLLSENLVFQKYMYQAPVLSSSDCVDTLILVRSIDRRIMFRMPSQNSIESVVIHKRFSSLYFELRAIQTDIGGEQLSFK